MNFQENQSIPFVIGWCLPDTVYLVAAAYVSEMMKTEVEKTNSYIDKLSINTEYGKKKVKFLQNII